MLNLVNSLSQHQNGIKKISMFFYEIFHIFIEVSIYKIKIKHTT